ncbi:MAG: hypothetical protein K0R29_1169 [Pseudobdellovibrio sp.]|jgi:transcriptional regulator with XRE-family HTH domain|nr:hypothetical protein [Pseudobdellovibrio sp.]
MNIENLSQYNSSRFLKLLGLYIQQRRQELKLTAQEAANKSQLNLVTFEKIESGQHQLTDNELVMLADRLYLSELEILNLAKITQVQEIIEMTRELNANYPG